MSCKGLALNITHSLNDCHKSRGVFRFAIDPIVQQEIVDLIYESTAQKPGVNTLEHIMFVVAFLLSKVKLRRDNTSDIGSLLKHALYALYMPDASGNG